MKFWLHDLRVGPVHVSIVRNEALGRLMKRRFGWFLAWERRWLAGTVRIGSFCLNLDVDAR